MDGESNGSAVLNIYYVGNAYIPPIASDHKKYRKLLRLKMEYVGSIGRYTLNLRSSCPVIIRDWLIHAIWLRRLYLPIMLKT